MVAEARGLPFPGARRRPPSSLLQRAPATARLAASAKTGRIAPQIRNQHRRLPGKWTDFLMAIFLSNGLVCRPAVVTLPGGSVADGGRTSTPDLRGPAVAWSTCGGRQ